MLALHLVQRATAGRGHRLLPDLSQGGPQAVAVGKDHGPLDEVLQLPDIPRPPPRAQRMEGFSRNTVNLPSHFGAVLGYKMADQLGNVLGPVPQRRRRDREHLQPVIQIAAEELVAHHLRQIPVGGGHQSDVDRDGPSSPQPFERLFLQRSQQLRLQIQRDVAHLVQEQGPPVGHFETADLLRQRAGERTPLVAEQLALQ